MTTLKTASIALMDLAYTSLLQMRTKYPEGNAYSGECNREDLTTLCKGWVSDISGLVKTAIDNLSSDKLCKFRQLQCN